MSAQDADTVAELRSVAYDLRRWAPPSVHCNVAASSLERIAWDMEQSSAQIDEGRDE